MRSFRVLCWMGVLLSMAWGFETLHAQGDPNFDTGFRPWGSYHGGNIDHVSLTSGTLNVDIPIISYPQAGGKLKLSFSLHYENLGDFSNEIFGKTSGGTPYHYWQDWNGTGKIHHGFYVIQDDAPSAQSTSAPDPYASLERIVTSLVVMPDGSSHQVVPTTRNSNDPWEAVDTSGFRWTSAGVYDPNGILYAVAFGLGAARVPPSSVQDANGNKITYSSSTGWKDTLNRAIPLQVATTDYSGCTGQLPITSATIWNLPGVNGGTYPIKFCYITLAETDPAGGLGWDQNSPSATNYNVSTLQSMVFMNSGQAWTFQYTTDSTHYNDLAQITFPTGGTLSYTWSSYNVCHTQGYLFNRSVTSRTMNPNDGITPASVWTYTYGAPGSATIVTDPNLNDIVHTLSKLPINTISHGTEYSCLGYETQTQFFQGSHSGGSLLKTVTTTLTDSQPTNVPDQWPNYTAANIFPTGTTNIWPNGQQNQTQQDPDNAVTFYSPIITTGTTGVDGQSFTGMHGDIIATREYDYGNGAPGPLRRTTSTSYLALSNSSYLANNLLKLPSNVRVTGAGPGSYTTYGYDEPNGSPSGARGNQTSVNRWLNTTGGYLTTSFVYSSAGLVTSSKDPKLNPTTYGYGACYAGSGPTSITNAQNQTTNYCYDFNTGLTTSVTDRNGQPTSYTYDNMLRMSQITYPQQTVNGVQLNGVTTFSYPTTTQVQFSELMDNTGRYRISNLQVDGVGREIRRNTANGESIPYDQVDTCYDGLGHVSYKSYPYQSTGLSAVRVCSGAGDSFTFDGLSRTKSVTHSDGSSVQTAYTGRATSVTDEGNGTQGVQRISQVDGMGRLTSLCEVSGSLTVGISGSQSASSCGLDISGTGFVTPYAYDALDNLTSVVQSPLNSRAFVYDSLSRLTQATNPESGTTCYGTLSGGVCQQNGYDANGNLVTKTDARPVTTTYSYDTLNELTGKTYTDSTPSVTYSYGQSSAMGVSLTNTVGRRSSMSTAATGSYGPTGSVFSYDSMGRVLNNSQCTPLNCGSAVFPIAYTYDLLGDTLTATNGTGMTLTYPPYNPALRVMGLTSSLSDSSHPGTLYSSPHYNAAGSVLTACIGNPGSCVNETRTYDGRLRLASITDGSVYNASIPASGGYAPNGDILLANDSVNGNWIYGYDAFNRLTSASATGQAYTYAYDRFGNRWKQNGPHSSQPGFDTNNHMIPGLGVTYDAAGNETNDGTTAYTYDSENRIITATNSTSGAFSYLYDADGRRIRKTIPGNILLDYLYDLSGRGMTQVTATGSWYRGEVYAGGQHIATYFNGTTYFNFADWLGTERARSVTGATTPCETVTSLPFGDWLTTAGSCGDPSPMHFTGKERDSESGLDNFGARYDASQYGRFMTPDETFADQGQNDPQSWNLYPYARNNPLRNSDDDGRACVQVNGIWVNDESGGQTCQEADDLLQRNKPSIVVTPTRDESNLMMLQSVGENLSSPTQLADVARHGMEEAMLAEGIAGTVRGIAGLLTSGTEIMAKLTPEELAMMNELKAAGNEVEQLPRIADKKTADFLVNGVKTELKTVTGSSPTSIKNAIEAAAKQGKNILIDARGSSLSAEQAANQIARAQGNVGNLAGRVTVLTRNGIVKF